MSGGYIEPGDLDAALCDMIRHAVIDIAAWIDSEGGGHQGSFTLDDVNWDHPATIPTGSDFEKGAKASHSIGFICGVAAGLDITPMTLIESYEERETTKKALAYYACVSDPSAREDAERALRMFDRMNADKSMSDETMRENAERFAGRSVALRVAKHAQRAKRPTAERRQKIRTIK